MIRRQIIALLFVLPFMLAASSSSRTMFVLTSIAPEATSNALISAAATVIEQNGFHRATENMELNYQHNSAAIWVKISSPSARQLRLEFRQLRGGCRHVKEIDGANALMLLVASSLQQTFGPITVTEEISLQREK